MNTFHFKLGCALLLIGVTACNKSMKYEAEEAMAGSARTTMQKGLPLKGTYTTSAKILVGPPVMQQEISGVGQSTHLGRSTFVAYPTIYFTTPPPFSNEGTASFKAANGDEFFTVFTGTVTPNTDGTNTVVMQHEITGGTGRFEGATGNFTGFTIAVPGHAEGTVTYEGTISY